MADELSISGRKLKSSGHRKTKGEPSMGGLAMAMHVLVQGI